MKQAHLVTLLLGCVAGSALAQPVARYTNAELVSVDAQTRLVVIKNTEGQQQTLMLDDNLAGLGEFRAGDRVILALREEPGMMRVSSIAKSQARAAASNPPAKVTPPAASVAVAVPPGLAAFSDRVAALALQAGQIDALWSEFKTSCNVTSSSSYADGRGWFGLWEEGAVQMDVSSSTCRDMFNQLLSRGETVKSGMAQAEEAARKADLAPGDLRDVRRRYSMEWGGWGLAAPEPLKQ